MQVLNLSNSVSGLSFWGKLGTTKIETPWTVPWTVPWTGLMDYKYWTQRFWEAFSATAKKLPAKKN